MEIYMKLNLLKNKILKDFININRDNYFLVSNKKIKYLQNYLLLILINKCYLKQKNINLFYK